jgi:hypothetical protein
MASRREVMDYAERHGAKAAGERYGTPVAPSAPGVPVPASGPPATGPHHRLQPNGSRPRPSGWPSGI